MAVLTSLAASAPAMATPGDPAPIPGAPTLERAWTARILYPVAGRAAPRRSAHMVARVYHYTAFSRRPQVLMVTGVVQDRSGREWVRVQLPKRPNGTEAWLPRASVDLESTTLRLRIRVLSKRVEVWRAGRLRASYRAAVGTGHTPTPLGLFAIQDPVASSTYQRSYLGPYILTLTAHSSVLREFMGGDGLIAIHGTNVPGVLGQAVSHGCVRVSNEAVTRLEHAVRPGTPVEIVRS
jgi:hypothetical protein